MSNDIRKAKHRIEQKVEDATDEVMASVSHTDDELTLDFKAKYLWLPKDAVISLEPGWIPLVELMFDGLEKILGNYHLPRNRITFLCLQPKRGSLDCNMTFDKSMSKAKIESCSIHISVYMDLIDDVCAYCGVAHEKDNDNFSKRSQYNVCDDHAGYRGVRTQMLVKARPGFLESSQREITRLSAVVPNWYNPRTDHVAKKRRTENAAKALELKLELDAMDASSEASLRADFDAAEKTQAIDSDDEIDEAIKAAGFDDDDPDFTSIVKPVIPMHKLFEVNEVELLLTHIDKATSDRGSKERLKAILTGMKQDGGMRPYGLVEDPTSFCNSLEEDFPNFKEAVDQLRLDLALSAANSGRIRVRPMLLVGDAGIGKTAFAKAIGKRMNSGVLIESMAGAQTSSSFIGTAAHWANTQTGSLFNILVNGKGSKKPTASPVVLIDELDKAAQRAAYNPLDSLYGLLEESTAAEFEDMSLTGVRLDTTSVIYLLTANDISMIPAPLLTRMMIVNVPMPTAEQAFVIAKNIYAEIINNKFLAWKFADELPNDIAEKLAGISPRMMHREITSALAKAVINAKHEVSEQDFKFEKDSSKKGGIGFMSCNS